MQRLRVCVFVALVITLATPYFITQDQDDDEYKPMNFSETQLLVESRLMEYYLQEKGKGCEIPKVDPFSAEAMKFVSNEKKIRCEGNDWVICNKSECYVKKGILKNISDVTCSYRDIVYVDDSLYFLSDNTQVSGDEKYTLNRSDHVKVSCSGREFNSYFKRYSRWSGVKAGFRPVKTKPIPPDRKDSYNVVFLAFDSTSHNMFIRKMPKSFKYLTDRAVILNGYNIVGDGTPAALHPLLSGMSEYEHPDARKTITKKVFVDHELFLFHQLKKYGYRSAYFEDTPSVGTFQYRFNGFRQQPADHYLRAFLQECENEQPFFFPQQYCVGDTPQYQLLLNLTNEFLRLDGKKFGFTFIADISHDDFNLIGTADEDVVWFLEILAARRVFDDTLVIVMGDHGSRITNMRNTYQGKLEERLPLMAIILPEKLKQLRPDALAALKQNIDVLTTPFDIHTTVLDVLNLKDKSNKYKVFGADLPRAMSLLEPIPKSRTCPEAGIVQHWCSCTKWSNVSHPEMYNKAAFALAEYIDSISEVQRSKCARRRLVSIEWVLQLDVNKHVLKNGYTKEEDSYLGNPIRKAPRAFKEYYQAKIILGPGRGVFEGTLAYNTQTNSFTIYEKDISRTSRYGDEPNCISATHPHLNKFCYCISHLAKVVPPGNMTSKNNDRNYYLPVCLGHYQIFTVQSTAYNLAGNMNMSESQFIVIFNNTGSCMRGGPFNLGIVLSLAQQNSSMNMGAMTWT